MGKGPLVKVKIGPGRYAKMHKRDAIEAGLLKPKKKRRKPAEDKMRRPEADKEIADCRLQVADCRLQVADCRLQIADCDDFSTIRGIGTVTAGRLQERGITTFEQLRTADVRGLPGRIRRAIEDWRESDDR